MRLDAHPKSSYGQIEGCLSMKPEHEVPDPHWPAIVCLCVWVYACACICFIL